MPEEGLLPQLKRVVVGEPIPSHQAHRERFSRVTGLAVLSSDPLSSVAYATEEILRVLALAGVAAFAFATPIGLAIAVILAIVAFSYRQTVYAYPSGGGAYVVAKDNLGTLPSLVAAASLLVDYTLTVAVSVVAGVAALTSAFPSWHINRVEMGLAFVAVIAVGNLRGVRESGRIFAVPTYVFIASILMLVGAGAWRAFTGAITPIAPPVDDVVTGSQPLTLFLLLTAFANGCTAMTGVEAVSNGVPAFRPPESKNAASTLVTMAALAITMFLGITLLAHAYRIVPLEHETIVSQLGRAVFGGRGVAYYLVQAATMLILVLAANTAYADFPRLASIVARDRFMPRQFMNQGDRLAFSNGILALSVFAGLLIVVFDGDTHALIPLYMIGVFISFTLSQFGMVRRWLRERGPGWRTSAAINAIGAAVTGVVLAIVAVTKAHEGAWIVLLIIPIQVQLFRVTRRHYDAVAAQLSLKDWDHVSPRRNIVLVPISGVHRAVVQAVSYARTLSPDVRALYVNIEPIATGQVRRDWDEWGAGVRLEVLDSPFRSLLEPLRDYIERAEAENPDAYITIVIPEFVPARWWHHAFHNQRALLIKSALLFKPRIVVTSVPMHFTR